MRDLIRSELRRRGILTTLGNAAADASNADMPAEAAS